VGLLFRDDENEVRRQARASASPTHTHPLGIEGAQLLAVAVAQASRADSIDRRDFLSQLLEECDSSEYGAKLKTAFGAETTEHLAALGNGIEATESVPTAVACFALTPDSYPGVIGNAILLGGDTDTIAAMGGALAGAFGGVAAIPERLLAMLEDQGKGRSYIRQLATRLREVHDACPPKG